MSTSIVQCAHIYIDAAATGKDFFRGALQLLAKLAGAVVVATYTDLPALNASSGSSGGVCRYPISMPIFNIEDAMKVVPTLTLPHTMKVNQTIYLRKLATLKLLLDLKLKGLGLISVLHRPHNKSDTTTKFLNSFQSAASISDEFQSINACIQCCSFVPESCASLQLHAAALLVGIPDKNFDHFCKLEEIITVRGGKISASLRRSLLNSDDPDVMAFTYGRVLFLDMLSGSNIYDSTPLEAAYIWVLSTTSAISKRLIFFKTSFTIQCRVIKNGRLFPGDSSSVIDTSFLRENVIYHALERVGGTCTHPLAVMFFISGEKELVLVDIIAAGGNKQIVKTKKKNLLKWIEENGGYIHGYSLHGVVLAPNIIINNTPSNYTRVPNTRESALQVVTGQVARALLGGLSQIFQWSRDRGVGLRFSSSVVIMYIHQYQTIVKTQAMAVSFIFRIL